MHGEQPLAQVAQVLAHGPRHLSQGWTQRQRSDPYVRDALRLGYRSRASFKLLQMDQKLRLLKPGMLALELGSSPGSWTQILCARGLQAVAVDELPMEELAGATFVLGSATSEATQATVLECLNGRRVDLVLSDMSPARSGHHSLDHSRIVSLVIAALVFARQTLRPGGVFLAKALQGEDHTALVQAMRKFGKLTIQKPAASRKESSEVYLHLTAFNHEHFDRYIEMLALLR